MTLKRNKLYAVLFIACLVGYIWLYFGLTKTHNGTNSISVCILKNSTNIPCPSCGTTRSVISILKGDFQKAIKLNPLGYINATILFVIPIWLSIDTLTKKSTLYKFYKSFESFLKNPKHSIPLIVLILMNWIWNITKGL